MESLHQVGSAAAGVAIVTVGTAGAIAAWLDRGHRIVRWLASLLIAVAVLQGAIGLALMAGGGAPREMLHLLYGAALAAIVPLALTFATEAPPRARSTVLAVAALVAAIIWWRLLVTG